MFSLLSIGVIELTAVAVCWFVTGVFHLLKSQWTTLVAFVSIGLTAATIFTPADIVSSVILVGFLSVAFVFGMKHQQRQTLA